MSDLESIFKSLDEKLAAAVEKGLRVDGKPGAPKAGSPGIDDAAGGTNDLTSETDASSTDGNYAKVFGKNFVSKAEFAPVADAILALAKAFKMKGKDADGDDDGDEGPIAKMLREHDATLETLAKALTEGVLPRLEKAENGGIVRKSLDGQDFSQGAGEGSSTGFDSTVRAMVGGAKVRMN